MIAFGCSVSEPEPYIRYAGPGIRLAAEPDSALLIFAAMDTLARSYNLLLDSAAQREDLEALVVLHPHAEIADLDLCAKVRRALSDPEVAVVGCAGATAVRSIAWWDGQVSRGEVTSVYTDYGGGSFPGFSWATVGPAPAEVEAVDGFLLVLSPWAVRNLRFDERLPLGHGYDVDLCLQARAAGRKVVTANLRVLEHRSLDIVSDPEMWVESHIAVARKWGETLNNGTGVADRAQSEESARHWARRAEAERECARAVAYFRRLGYDARIDALERSLEEVTSTPAWRLTEPLRRINKWRRDRAARGRAN
jgi:Glycosyltransferase like family